MKDMSLYETVARIQIRLGKVEQFLTHARELNAEKEPGLVNEYFYQMDEGPNVMYMAVVFESREAYRANSERPETHARAMELSEFAIGQPEWHDGTVVITHEEGN